MTIQARLFCLIYSLLLSDLAFGQAGPRPSNLPPASSDNDFYDNGSASKGKVELGRLLFYDKILSGNKNISCATCHHSFVGTSDGLSLPIGEGGRGLGVTRDTGAGADAVHERVPRNSPHVFNLGAKEFTVMFHDGRVAVDSSQASGFMSPAGDKLPMGLDNVLAAQAMFPVTSATEMAGQEGENPQADFAAAGELNKLWDYIAAKVRSIPEYAVLFKNVFKVSKDKITYVHIANALAAFEAQSWRFDNSPFDRYLRGESAAMSDEAMVGMRIFYGKGKCASCHSGTFQTDHQFHSIAMPQVGPGKGDGEFGIEDFGRERVTKNPEDRYRFRTPTLRNVELTGPWGHAGTFNSLEAVVMHHLSPLESLYDYDSSQLVLPFREDFSAIDMQVMSTQAMLAPIAMSNEMPAVDLSQEEVASLLSFLRCLTDPEALDMRSDVPMRLPSGLPVAD